MSLQRSQNGSGSSSGLHLSLPSRNRYTSVSRPAQLNQWFRRLIWVGMAVLCGASEGARATPPLPLAANVGQQSLPLTVTLTLSSSGIATAPQALTQGISGADFTVAPGGTCAAGASYTSGQQCSIDVVFAPKYPGLRSGAVVLAATNGSLLGSALLSGSATGSMSVLNPGRIDTVAGDGELNFRADGVPAIDAPIFLPYGVIVDPAGNIYLSDSNNSRIRRVDAGTGLISTCLLYTSRCV